MACEHAAAMILPGHVPLTDHKVRSNALFPLPNGYDAAIAKETAGDLAKPAQIEARSPSFGKQKAVTRSATAVFVGTAPYGATNNKGLEVARLRLACAVPGEQLAQFSDALRRMQQDGAAYLYAEGDRYWFSTQPTLNQLAEERAAAWPAPEVEAEITALLRAEEGKAQRGSGFLRVHGAPDEPVTLAAKANDPASLAQLAWSKCEQDGLIVFTLGVLDNDLAKVWQPPDQPHIAVRQLRDWFAQCPTSPSCASPRCWRRRSPKPWAAAMRDTPSQMASMRSRASMRASSWDGWLR